MEPEPDTQADLGRDHMLAFQAGDGSAFERLIALYSERAYALFVRFTGRHEGAEDLVQELFLRMWRARDRYEPSARFSTWMYRIAFNLAVNEGERRRNRQGISLEGHGEDGELDRERLADERQPDPGQSIEREDVVRQVQEAIAALPENQRMALILARYEELSHQEIGDALGISSKAVKSLVHRARETLRQTLAHVLSEEWS
ncbi:MAG: sigma-70 family RNA polymerase sigma factor [Planctomycetota bacterium]